MRLWAFIVSIFLITSCDYKECDLTIINNTDKELYFFTCPLNQEGIWTCNVAYKENSSDDPKYPDRYLDFENNTHSIGIGDTVADCIVNTSFKKFAHQYGGLTIAFFRREQIESKPPGEPLTVEDLYKKIDLTELDLRHMDYTIVIQ